VVAVAVTSSIFSPSWYRVANVVPRLRGHARVHRVHYRGRRWYLLQDRSSGRFHRFSPAAQALIGLMDGRRSVDEIWKLAADDLGDDLPSQDETIRLLAELYRANALVTDVPPDVAELAVRDERTARRKRWQTWRTPLALKIPILDPERWLARAAPFVAPLVGLKGAVLWLAVVGTALVLVARHWEALSHNAADRVLAAENLLLLWIAFPVVKALHELGHAFAVKRWGGEVHEMGVMLLVGIPVPYVDASASNAFASPARRAFVGAAGVIVELFVAALASVLWVLAEPGVLRALAFNVMVIASVSSLLFNGNPFLRFDAYYVLSDLLEIPNLAARANQYWSYWFQRWACGNRDAESPADAPGEAGWLAVYAVGALVARLAITLSIAVFVASRLFFVGVLLAAWSISQFALLPVLRQVRFLARDPRLRGRRGRAVLAAGGIVLLGALLLLVPVPSWTRCDGVVWAPEESLVRAEADGEVAELLAEPGARVEAGQPLVRLVDPELGHEADAVRANLAANRARLALERTRDRVETDVVAQAVAHAERRARHVEARLEGLVARSPSAGRFLIDAPGDWPGRFVRRGQTLGFVLAEDPVVVRVAVPASAVDLVRSRSERVDVRLASRPREPLSAQLRSEVPAATQQLPSLALSVAGGGELALDPTRGREGIAFEKFFLFDLALERGAEPIGVGERVHVRFGHPAEPLATQVYRVVRRVFLSRFSV